MAHRQNHITKIPDLKKLLKNEVNKKTEISTIITLSI